MNYFHLAHFVNFLICLLHVVDGLSDHPLVLLISLDGLNHKFISQSNTPNIWSLGQNGVIALKGIKVQVTTVTASNHHCIVTGLYQESHGIIDNTFYDPEFKEWFDIWNFTGNSETYKRSRMSHWYMGGEPIWQTNMQINGRLSGTYLWPMGDADIPTTKPKHKSKTWKDFYDLDEWKREIDDLLQWYTNETDPINLGLYYNAQPDHVEHDNDLYGENVTKAINELDQLIGYLVQRCKDLKIFDKLNLILTADHGHAMVKDEAHTFLLDNYLTKDHVINSSCSYFPRTDLGVTEDEIYYNFSRAVNDGIPLRVWRKNEFPERYHWKNNRRVGPVIMFYNFGYQVNSHTHPFPHGTHGYLNEYEEMNAFFVAHGPAFKKGYKIDTDYIQNIDIYPLMCHILGVEPSPNNGSLERIAVILNSCPDRKLYSDSFVVWFVIFAVVIPSFALFLYLTALCMSRRRNASQSTKKYSKLQTNSNAVDSSNENVLGSYNSKGASTKLNPGNSSNGMRVGNKPLLQLEKDGSSDDEL